jgi:hypothetical protein
LGNKKAGFSSEFCMILKKNSIGKRPFIGVCYGSRNITAYSFFALQLSSLNLLIFFNGLFQLKYGKYTLSILETSR